MQFTYMLMMCRAPLLSSEGWSVSDLHLDHDHDHQVRSCHNVEVPATHKVCSQVPHRACHQVSTPFSKCKLQTLCQVLKTVKYTSFGTFFSNTVIPRSLTRAAARCPPKFQSRWLVRWAITLLHPQYCHLPSDFASTTVFLTFSPSLQVCL